MKILYLKEEELDLYEDVLDPVSLDKVDIATIIDIYFKTKEELGSWKTIKGVKVDSDGFFFMLVSKEWSGGLDLYSYINGIKRKELPDVDPRTAKVVYNESLSRGVFVLEDEVDSSVPTIEETEDIQEEATGYMDHEVFALTLMNKKSGVRFNFSKGKTRYLVGRSKSEADFLAKNNINVGRKHCYLERSNKKLTVEVIPTKNGTFLNGTRLCEGDRRVLVLGDTLELADEEYMVVKDV